MMARDRVFILPVCLDVTPNPGTDVPESFHRVHWTRLPGGEAHRSSPRVSHAGELPI
jgi:hypothetical protein